MYSPNYIAIDSDKNLLICDRDDKKRIRKFKDRMFLLTFHFAPSKDCVTRASNARFPSVSEYFGKYHKIEFVCFPALFFYDFLIVRSP